MIFGRVPLGEAEGAVLAHTLRLGRGQVFKKGRVLSPDDVGVLREAGHGHVTAARLEPGDVAEDDAAGRVAEALAGSGLVAGESFTGRCNLYAAHHGVLHVEPPAIDALNAVDEAITVATLQPNAVVEPDEMVATVKVIPFSAPDTAVSRCEALGRRSTAGRGPLEVAALTEHPVGLILTRLPGTHERVLDRAEKNTRVRVRALGSRLAQVERCEHTVASVAAALGRLREGGCAPILILGASAIVDRKDVVPSAVIELDGTIQHFGMPVDPGNLLLLASLHDVPVIGVPGCARSLKPSGFDWVLGRSLAGLPLEGPVVMSMGVGGLLDEVGARVQPRAQRARQPRRWRVAAVVLAAGQSRRMGTANKLLSDVRGRPMVEHVISALTASKVDEIVVVTGHEAGRVRDALDRDELRFVHNPDYSDGLSTSLRAGIAALEDEVDGALICLGDMPWIRAEHVDGLIDAFDPERGREIVVPFAQRKRGNPILWGARFFAAMQRLEGDVGARGLLERHRDAVFELATDDQAVLLDIDTPDALAAVKTQSPVE